MADASEPETWIDLCDADDVRPGGEQGHYVEAAGRSVAVFRPDDEQVVVCDNACPHAGASLAGGHIRDGCVVCPFHFWAFDTDSGACPDNPAIGVAVYPARIQDGRIEAQLPATAL
ncbi:MAG: Rieske (2Fe-2S) protein [Phycisphaeraceae bacterium]|nr:Rieske (2Fe-2S) protein [Phycisphaeraceae bacterium]